MNKTPGIPEPSPLEDTPAKSHRPAAKHRGVNGDLEITRSSWTAGRKPCCTSREGGTQLASSMAQEALLDLEVVVVVFSGLGVHMLLN